MTIEAAVNEAARDIRHDEVIDGLKALLTKRRQTDETHRLLAITSRDGLTVTQELALDIKQRCACKAAAAAETAYNAGLDAYEKEFSHE